MSILISVAAISLLQAPIADPQHFDVAYEELVADENDAAITRIEANVDIAADDPARMINLGIAYAREGRIDEARVLFVAVIADDDRVSLETADGTRVDSKRLANRALAMLDRGQLSTPARLAAK